MDAEGGVQDKVAVLAGQETVQTEGQPPSVEKPEPSTLPETFTKEQVDKLLGERHSKLDKRIAALEKLTARSTKALELAVERATTAETALTKAEKEQEEKELADVQDNEPELRLFQAKQRQKVRDAELSKREKELEASKTEHEEAIREHQNWKRSQVAAEIASKYEGVDPGLLLQLTDGTPEKMELLAGQLGILQAKTPKTPLPDSGLTFGGVGKPTAEQLEKMSSEQYAEWASKRFK